MNTHFVVQNGVDALSLGSMYALFALGIALIFGIMQLINFAHGQLIMIGAYSAVFLVSWPTYLFIPAVTAIVVGLALVMERVAFRPVRGADPTALLITSFAVSFILQHLAILVFGSLGRSVNLWPTLITKAVHLGTITVPMLDLIVIATTAGLLVSMVLFLRRTKLGVQMRAAAEDFQMARALGVRADRVVAAAFAASGVLAAAAAMLLVAEVGQVDSNIGTNPLLVAFVATILGGMGSMVGAVVGGYMVGVATTVFQAALPLELRSYRDAFAYLLVIGVLVVRPRGLFATRTTRERI